MIGSEGINPDILGIEMTPTVIRGVRMNRENRSVVAAAEVPIAVADDSAVLDPGLAGPALDDMMFQLKVDDRSRFLAAVSIGPERAGVGSGPALSGWLEQRARQIGENIISAGKLGIAFCPQRPLDTAIMICEQANITVTRIDFAPVAAARILDPGVDTVVLGSGRGWRARLRDDEVLEALESDKIDRDEPLSIVAPDGLSVSVESYEGASIDANLDSAFELNLGQLAPAVGAALGVIDGSAGNLLDGETIRAQPIAATVATTTGGTRLPRDVQAAGRLSSPAAADMATGPAGIGIDPYGGRTTVDLHRPQGDGSARSVLRQSGTVVESDGFDPSGRDAFGVGRQTDIEVHPDDPIRGFSPDPNAERELDRDGRGMVAVAIALILLSIAVGIVIYVVAT